MLNHSFLVTIALFRIHSGLRINCTHVTGSCIPKQTVMDHTTRLENNEGGDKRQIPPAIQKLLAYDVEMTKRFVSFSLNFVPIRSLKSHCKFLEVLHIHISDTP